MFTVSQAVNILMEIISIQGRIESPECGRDDASSYCIHLYALHTHTPYALNNTALPVTFTHFYTVVFP